MSVDAREFQGSRVGDASTEQVRILLVGSDPALRRGVRDRLTHPRWSIREAHSGADAFEKLASEPSEVLVLEPRLPDLDWHEFQEMVRSEFQGIEIVTWDTETGMLSPVIEMQHRFAYELRDLLEHSPRHTCASAPTAALPATRSVGVKSGSWHGMIGGTPAMQRVFRAANLVARHDTTVLIQGESGTGKDLLARGIHLSGAREKQPFAVINCAAIPESLLEAELFGYTKGAFTGAVQSRVGRIHAAHGGTLFLDEIGDMPFPLQSKILRFLEQGEVQRIGGTDVLKVDCRVIAATNAHLKDMVKANKFREDLYYRLAIFPLHLPPLRERMEDLDALIETFLSRFCPGVGLSLAAREVLLGHNWPGNVRELRNVMERASLFADGRNEILAEDIVL